jgi:hypothetical protein
MAKKYHLTPAVRNHLCIEILEAASERQRAAVQSLIEWAQGGFKGETPAARMLSAAARDDLNDDLEYIFQPACPKGFRPSAYDRRFVTRRRRALRSQALQARRNEELGGLRELLTLSF